MLFHKKLNKQIQLYTIQQHLKLEKPVKPVKYVVSFIGKELAEDRRSCHQVTLKNDHILVTLFFKLANFLIMLRFLIILISYLLRYVCIKYGYYVAITFHIYSA